MPRAQGLMNPENAAKSAGLFREGFVRINSNSYKVHLAKGEDAVPATKWIWNVTRLNESGEEPLVDEHENPITEELYFSLGGKCLPFVHPGKADSPDDDDVEDMGIDLGAEGNTVFLVAQDWTPNEKSSLMMLTTSMSKQGVKAEYLNRCWTPDWNGCVFEMKTLVDKNARDGREIPYKIVSKMLVGPGGKKSGAAKASAKSQTSDVETVLVGVIMKLSEDMDGKQLTRKAFVNRVREALDEKKVDSKLIVPALNLCKNEQWLKDHAETLDMTFSENAVLFGRLVETEA